MVKKNVIHHHSSKHELGLKNKGKSEPLFSHDETDDKWLEYVGKQQWIVFSQDRKFHKEGYESEMFAIKQFNIGCFYLWGADARTHEKASVFLKAYDRILEAVQTTQKPFIYDVMKSGRLVQIGVR